jgi:hypothetical protein
VSTVFATRFVRAQGSTARGTAPAVMILRSATITAFVLLAARR